MRAGIGQEMFWFSYLEAWSFAFGRDYRTMRSSERPSRPGESHPEALTDPCLSLSAHTARAIHRELPLSATISRFLLLPVDQVDHDANGLPPSLCGRYPASTLLRGSPSLTGVSVLSASRGYHLCLFPSHRRSSSQVPYRSPDESHAACTPDTAWPVGKVTTMLFPESGGAPVLMPSED